MLPKDITVQARKQREAEDALTTLVLDHYIETGKSATVKELAAYYAKQPRTDRPTHLRFNEARIRTTLVACGGAPKGVSLEHERRDSMSKNYSHISTGSHAVIAYLPTRAQLRIAFASATQTLRTQQRRATEILDDSKLVDHLDVGEATDFLCTMSNCDTAVLGPLSILDWGAPL